MRQHQGWSHLHYRGPRRRREKKNEPKTYKVIMAKNFYTCGSKQTSKFRTLREFLMRWIQRDPQQDIIIIKTSNVKDKEY